MISQMLEDYGIEGSREFLRATKIIYRKCQIANTDFNWKIPLKFVLHRLEKIKKEDSHQEQVTFLSHAYLAFIVSFVFAFSGEEKDTDPMKIEYWSDMLTLCADGCSTLPSVAQAQSLIDQALIIKPLNPSLLYPLATLYGAVLARVICDVDAKQKEEAAV